MWVMHRCLDVEIWTSILANTHGVENIVLDPTGGFPSSRFSFLVMGWVSTWRQAVRDCVIPVRRRFLHKNRREMYSFDMFTRPRQHGISLANFLRSLE